jgi:hypothetical protein
MAAAKPIAVPVVERNPVVDSVDEEQDFGFLESVAGQLAVLASTAG